MSRKNTRQARRVQYKPDPAIIATESNVRELCGILGARLAGFLVLHYAYGWTAASIAAVANLSEEHTRQLLQRATRRLRLRCVFCGMDNDDWKDLFR